MSFICPNCGCDEFYAHQTMDMCVKVNIKQSLFQDCDPDCEVLEVMEGAEYDYEEAHGPFECVECGEEFSDYDIKE